MTAARIGVVLRKEIAQIRRDRRLFGLLLFAPVFQLLVMGFAASTDVRLIRLGVRDHDQTPTSREYVRTIGASGYFRPIPIEGPAANEAEALVDGHCGLVLILPTDFARSLGAGRTVAVQALVDGTDSNFGVQGLNYLQKANRLFNVRRAAAAAEQFERERGTTLPAVEMETRVWYNPALASRLYFVPGIMALLLMVTTLLVTSMALVKEREDGTIEQLIVTPLRPSELMIGKLLPFVLIGAVMVTIALPVNLYVFHVPLRGNLGTLYAMSGLFLLTTLGLGLFISTLVKTQQQAMLVATFFVMMPFVLLSGFIFPVSNIPPALRWVSSLIPLKYFLTALRGIFLKGLGWADLWREALVLAAWGVGIFLLASAKFRKRLD